MIYLIAGALIAVFGILVQCEGHFYTGFTVFVIGGMLGIKGKRQVYSKKE